MDKPSVIFEPATMQIKYPLNDHFPPMPVPSQIDLKSGFFSKIIKCLLDPNLLICLKIAFINLKISAILGMYY